MQKKIITLLEAIFSTVIKSAWFKKHGFSYRIIKS